MLLQVAFAALVVIAVADQCDDCPGFCTCIITNMITPMQADTELRAKVEKLRGAFKECTKCSGEEACKAVFEFFFDEKRRRRRGAEGDMEKTEGKMKAFAEEHNGFHTCVREKSGMRFDEMMALGEALKPMRDAEKECMMGKCFNNDREAVMRLFRRIDKCVKQAFQEAERNAGSVDN